LKSPLKLGYLVSQYPAVNHTYLLREVQGLRALGFDICVASIRPADRPFDRLLPEEQEEVNRTYYVKRAGTKRMVLDQVATLLRSPISYAKGLWYALKTAGFSLRRGVRHLAYFAQAVMVGCWMRRNHLHHVHTHFSSTVSLFLSKVFPITFSMTVHGPDEFKNPVGFLLPEKIAASLFICTISNFGRSQLRKCSPTSEWSKFEVVPLGVDISVFIPRLFRPKPERLEILCVGRLSPAKAQHVLIAAAEQLIKEGYKLRIRFAGDGPDRPMLEGQVRQRGLTAYAVFEGNLHQERIRDLYRETDVFALASFAEGVPVVLMEAMAMEIPCVATCVAGVPELIRDEVDGLLVPPADDNSLARAIARLQDDCDLRKRLGKSARLRVIDRYDLRKNLKLLADTFRIRLGGEIDAFGQ